jgi:hypothetical protein
MNGVVLLHRLNIDANQQAVGFTGWINLRLFG